MSDEGIRPLRNILNRRRPLRKLLNRDTSESNSVTITNKGAESGPVLSEPLLTSKFPHETSPEKGVSAVLFANPSPSQGGTADDEAPITNEKIVPTNFPGDHAYTLNTLVEELTLAERHLRDGSWKLCDCNPEKHLPMIAGLASEGYGFAKDGQEKAFMMELRDNARIFKDKIEKGQFVQQDAEELRAWTREMRHRISFKTWTGEMAETPELDFMKQRAETMAEEFEEFDDDEVPDYEYKGQLYLLSSEDCPKCEVMKHAMNDVIKEGIVITTNVDDDIGYDIITKLHLNAVPTLVLRNPDGSYEEVTDESQLTGI